MTTKDNVQQKCIFIVGMHRSGTSALTGILQLMGVELGKELMQPWADNPKGFFENNKIWKYNQRILESFDSSWEDPFLYGADWTLKHDLRPFKPHIDNLLEEEFSVSPLFAIKDPRMCILFPLWREICVRNKITPLCVLPFRHPLEVAKSLRKRNGFSIEQGILLWINYVLTSESVTRECPRVFLRFDDLFSNSQGLLDNITSNLGISFPRVYESIQSEVESFLDRGLKHHSESKLGITRLEVVAEELYLLFCRTAGSRSQDASWCTEVEKLREEYGDLVSFFLNNDMQTHYVRQQEVLHLEKRIKKLQKDNENLRHIRDGLEEEVTRCSSMNMVLKNEIEAMANTKIWRLAEKLRGISGYKKHAGG